MENTENIQPNQTEEKNGKRTVKNMLVESAIWPQVAEMLSNGDKLLLVAKFIQDNGFMQESTVQQIVVNLNNTYIKKLTAEQKIRRAESLAKRNEQEMKDGSLKVSQLSSQIKVRTTQLKNQLATLGEVENEIKEIGKLEEIYLRQLNLFDETAKLAVKNELAGINSATNTIKDQISLIIETTTKLMAFKKDLGIYSAPKPEEENQQGQKIGQVNFFSGLSPELQREFQQNFIRMFHDLKRKEREAIPAQVVDAQAK